MKKAFSILVNGFLAGLLSAAGSISAAGSLPVAGSLSAAGESLSVAGSLSAAGSISAAGSLSGAGSISAARAGSIKVLVVDGYSNHDWAYSTEVITSLLEQSGFCRVDITTAPLNDAPDYEQWRPDFCRYDVVVQNSTNLSNGNYWPKQAQQDFEEYMKNGGGMFVFHAANSAFYNWEEFNKMIALGWRKADQGEAIEIVDGEMVRIPSGEGPGTNHGPRSTIVVEKLTSHPINDGYPDKWKTPDLELYVYARGPAENLEVLSTTYDERTAKNWPVDWIVKYGEGRVYNGTYGHLWHEDRMPESIECVAFQTTFYRAIQWLAGEKVSYKVPDNFPTSSEVSLQPLELIYRDQDGWKKMYNGRNLDGWHVECLPEDRGKGYWSAKGPVIECNSLGQPDHDYFWLMNDKEYGDFQLRLEFQIFKDSKGNSGVQFRSRFDKNDKQSAGGWLNGPQSDIDPPTPLRAGLIYDESRGYQRWIHPSLPDWTMVAEKAPKEAHETVLLYADDDPDVWNSMEILCIGMQIRTFVNGKRVTKFDATGILDDEIHRNLHVGTIGHIALQLHAKNELLIRYRNLYIREINHSVSNK